MAGVTKKLDFPVSLVFVLFSRLYVILHGRGAFVFCQLAGDPSSGDLQRRVGFRQMSPVVAPRNLPGKEQCFSAGELQDRTPSSKSRTGPLVSFVIIDIRPVLHLTSV